MPSPSHGPRPDGQSRRSALQPFQTGSMNQGHRKQDDDLLYGIDLVPTIDVTLGDYRLCFARTGADLEAVRRLRYAVFNLSLIHI